MNPAETAQGFERDVRCGSEASQLRNCDDRSPLKADIVRSPRRAAHVRRPRNRGVRSCQTMKIAHCLPNAPLGTKASQSGRDLPCVLLAVEFAALWEIALGANGSLAFHRGIHLTQGWPTISNRGRAARLICGRIVTTRWKMQKPIKRRLSL